jgi:COP9 signalosome complex subunit 1
MDYSEYLSRYSETGQMARCLYLIQEGPSSIYPVVYKFIRSLLKNEDQIQFYKEVVSAFRSKHVSFQMISEDEVESFETKYKDKVDNKEYKINQSKNAGLKDSYRLNILELGDYNFNSWDLSGAMKVYLRAKDVTVTPDHQYELSTRMGITSLYKKNYSFAQNNAQKVLMLPSIPENKQISCFIILGLCNIDSANYKQAVENFLRIGSDNNGEILTNSDLAGYISLCSLVSIDRGSISSDIIKSKAFLSFAEDDPIYIELLESFLTCKFSKVMQILDQIKIYLSHDIFIGKAINSIYDEIKNKSLVQFMKAFKKIRIVELANNFCCGEDYIEKKLARLIMDGKIDARIDAHLKIATSRQVDEKNKVNRSVVNTAKRYLKNNQLLLLRMSMIQEGIIVKANRTI